MQLDSLLDPVAPDMARVNEFLRDAFASSLPLIHSLSDHIIGSGGKRLRPAVLLMSARACGITNDAHIQLAAAVEIVHTATLLHDDVVDRSGLRRGRRTANAIWGNSASVLVGDFLYSRATQLILELDRIDILRVLSDASNDIAEGEILQLQNVQNVELSEADYLRIIYAKTARLFEASSECGALVADAPAHRVTALRDFGMHLGLAFQLVDDVLDYDGDAELIGKNLGDDLAEGKMTLPLIRALQQAPAAQAERIREAVRAGALEQLDEVLATIESTGAIAYTAQLAQHHAAQAQMLLGRLPDSSCKAALGDLLEFAVLRRF